MQPGLSAAGFSAITLPRRTTCEPRRPQPDRLDRVARLQHDEVGVAARLEAVAVEAA